MLIGEFSSRAPITRVALVTTPKLPAASPLLALKTWVAAPPLSSMLSKHSMVALWVHETCSWALVALSVACNWFVTLTLTMLQVAQATPSLVAQVVTSWARS
jgi:hypothetical protein